ISEQKERLDSIYTTTPEEKTLSNILINSKDNYFQNHYEKELEQFLSEKSIEQQIALGNNIVSQLSILERIHESAVEIAKAADKLDKLYTVYTFDPFTYSDGVPTRAKKRL